MPKHKIKRNSTAIDMTAMCDVSFLLLTFFMLATKFKPPEPVTVVTPSSISDTKIADKDIMLITFDKSGKVFFDMDQQPIKMDLINALNDDRKLGLTEAEKKSFVLGSSIGVPFNQLKGFLALTPEQQKEFKSPGIPVDTALTASNELFKWVAFGRVANSKARIVLKGDAAADYPAVNMIIKTLANDDVKGYKFNLVTALKEKKKPE